MAFQPEDYETPELSRVVQVHNLLSLLRGEGSPEHVAAMKAVVEVLWQGSKSEDLIFNQREMYRVAEKLRPIFAQHESLWPILFKKKPSFPEGMFIGQKAAAEFIVRKAATQIESVEKVIHNKIGTTIPKEENGASPVEVQ